MQRSVSTYLTLLLLALLFGGRPALAGEVAGHVIFATGQAFALHAGGKRVPLHRGDAIEPGDTVITGRGRAQVRFSDGGFISVEPHSRFSVEQYHYDGKADGTEKGIFRLVKGGLRAVTGVIGHRHKRSYRLKTMVASIGIRGTAYTVLLCQGQCTNIHGKPLPDGLYVKTGEGEIYLFNAAGSLDIAAGQSAYVPDAHTPPRTWDEPPLFGMIGDLKRLALNLDFSQAERVDADGVPLAFASVAGRLAPILRGQSGGAGSGGGSASSLCSSCTLVAGSANINSTSVMSDFLASLTLTSGSGLTLDSNGYLSAWQSGSMGFASGSAVLSETGSATVGGGVVSWGRWGNGYSATDLHGIDISDHGAATGYHFMVGAASPADVFTRLSGTVTYTHLAGGTSPTFTDSFSGTSTGTFSNPSIAIDFTNATATGQFTVSDSGGASFTPSINASFPSGATTKITFTANLSSCGAGSSCYGQVIGTLTGNNAEGVMLGYDISDSDGISTVIGTALVTQ